MHQRQSFAKLVSVEVSVEATLLKGKLFIRLIDINIPKRKFFSVFLRPCMIFSRLSPIMSVPAIHKKNMHNHIWPCLYCRIYLVNFFHFNYYLRLYMGRCWSNVDIYIYLSLKAHTWPWIKNHVWSYINSHDYQWIKPFQIMFQYKFRLNRVYLKLLRF